MNEVIEDKSQNKFEEQEADELQQEETEESASIAEKSEEAQIDNSSEEELAEESVPVQEESEEKQSELKFFIFPTFILFLVIDAFRKFSVGSDLHVYVSIFEQNALKLPEFSNIFKSRFEVGYILSN